MRKVLFSTLIAMAASAALALCGPFLTLNNFTNSNFGLTGAKLEFWNCDGQQWVSIKNSTSGGNGSYAMKNDLISSSTDGTKTYTKYTPNDGIEREMAIVIEEEEAMRIFVVAPDGTVYVVYLN